jgi:hypothetical protein
LLHDVGDPRWGEAQILEKLLLVAVIQPATKGGDGVRIDVLAAEPTQSLDDRAADAARHGHLTSGGVLEEDLLLPELDRPRPAVGQENGADGNLI